MLKISSSSILAVAITFFISGCTQSSQIIKVEKDNVEQYKIFEQSLFEDTTDVAKRATSRASKFCSDLNGEMEIISEHTNKPPYIIDNYPGTEIIFICKGSDKERIVERKAENENSEKLSLRKDKYENLTTIKRLLDDGTLTQQEFDEEKRKILADD